MATGQNLETLTVQLRVTHLVAAEAREAWLSEIFAELDRGASRASVAERAGISKSRLYQILAERNYRKAS